MTQEEAMKLALEALEDTLSGDLTPYQAAKTITALRQAIEQAQKQEPMACEKQYMQLFLDPENQPTQFGTATQEYRAQEIKEEREACAKLCDDLIPFGYNLELQRATADDCATAIRARGEQA